MPDIIAQIKVTENAIRYFLSHFNLQKDKFLIYNYMRNFPLI